MYLFLINIFFYKTANLIEINDKIQKLNFDLVRLMIITFSFLIFHLLITNGEKSTDIQCRFQADGPPDRCFTAQWCAYK